VKYLVGEGMDTNASGMSRLELCNLSLIFTSDKFGRTCLHYASRLGHLNIVQYLVEKNVGTAGMQLDEKGSDVNATGQSYSSDPACT
jgi:ankyrin repeat protein